MWVFEKTYFSKTQLKICFYKIWNGFLRGVCEVGFLEKYGQTIIIVCHKIWSGFLNSVLKLGFVEKYALRHKQ